MASAALLARIPFISPHDPALFKIIHTTIDGECRKVKATFPLAVCHIIDQYLRCYNPFAAFARAIPFGERLNGYDVSITPLTEDNSKEIADITQNALVQASSRISSKFMLEYCLNPLQECLGGEFGAFRNWVAFQRQGMSLKETLFVETFYALSFSPQTVTVELNLSSDRTDYASLLSSISSLQLVIIGVSDSENCTYNLISISALTNLAKVSLQGKGKITQSAHLCLEALSKNGTTYAKSEEIEVVPDVSDARRSQKRLKLDLAEGEYTPIAYVE